MRHKLTLGAAIVVLAGCATVSQMEATGGSRSDGIVKLSFEYGMFDKIEIDQASALEKAKQRCAVWGYTNADAFGGIVRQCQAYGSFGCTHWFVTREYQCTMGGANSPPLTEASAPSVELPPMPTNSGPRKVHAKTRSGYCLDVPDNYIGTGAANSPVVTPAMPRCDQLSTTTTNDPSPLRKY
jgi:hypothetical protein